MSMRIPPRRRISIFTITRTTKHTVTPTPWWTPVSLGFGIAHGLAGSGAIAALLVAAVPDAASRLAYFAAFGAGTVAGMLSVSLTLSAVVRVAAERSARLATILHVGAAAASVVAGVVLAQQIISRPKPL